MPASPRPIVINYGVLLLGCAFMLLGCFLLSKAHAARENATRRSRNPYEKPPMQLEADEEHDDLAEEEEKEEHRSHRKSSRRASRRSVEQPPAEAQGPGPGQEQEPAADVAGEQHSQRQSQQTPQENIARPSILMMD